MEESFAEGEAFIEAERNTKKPHPNQFCLNCGTKLEGTYCHQCGQKDIPRRQVIGDLVSNFIEAFTNFDGKFLRTTRYLFLKPGFLAIEYNKGKRETYFHPVRMYTFASFLFFLLFVILPDGDNEAVNAELSKEEKQQLDSLKKTGMTFSMMKVPYKTLTEYDSIQQTLPEGQQDGWWERLKTRKAIEISNKYKSDGKGLVKNFMSFFTENFSTALFFLMPFFALVLKLLYSRRDFFYAEHLVFTIYYYNFFYLAGALMMIFDLIPYVEVLSVFIGFWIFFYLLFAMKRMYAQGWGKTIAKFFIFNFLFFNLVLIAIIVMLLFAVMTL
ncbi:MAG: DUF3667 domain-containing protein [Bacteroidota bacterium]